jgi:serine O-acetyltransferase
MRAGLRGDLDRLFAPGGLNSGKPSIIQALERGLTRPGPLAILLFRASHVQWVAGHETFAEVVWRLNYFLTGADIHPGADIGGGIRITHTAGLVIGRGARIGANVTILHGVTIGGSGRQWFRPDYVDGYPTIGDETHVMAHAMVLGPVRVGSGCFVGANAVLAHDLADGEAFVPGRQISELRHRVADLEEQIRSLERNRRG